MKKNLLLLLVTIVLTACTTTSDSNGNKTTTVVPLPPSNLTGKATSTTEINLSWTDNSTNELGFKIERKTGTGIYSVIYTTNSNIVTIIDINLIPSTTYTYRVCSYNSTGNSSTYSNEITVTTNTPITKPILTTTTPNTITKNSAISGGNISSDGGATITARGIVWGTTTSPTIANSTKTVDGVGSGVFSSNLQNLTPSTTIYARAYATNSEGTSYGNEVTITTLPSLQIGDEYQGGIIFYIFDQAHGPGLYIPGEIHGLIMTKNDLPSRFIWGCYGSIVGNLRPRLVGFYYHDMEDTIKIVNKCGINTAAGACYNLNLNGYDDWYLPNFSELESMFNNINNSNYSLKGRHWSSTTEDREELYFAYARESISSVGIIGYVYDYKSNALLVRPIRRF
jgi:hypothetical protein